MSKPSRLAFLAVAGALFAAALTLASFPATAQITPVIPRIVSKTGGGVPPLPGLAKIESVTWRGSCGKDGSLVVTIRNAGGPIRCHGVVSISRGRTLGGAVAGSAAFTGLGLGETKTFTIRVEGVFNCCPRDCYVVTIVFDPDCLQGQPWDHSARLVCVSEPSTAVLAVSPLTVPR